MKRYLVLLGLLAMVCAVLLVGDGPATRTAAQEKQEKKVEEAGQKVKVVAPLAELLDATINVDFQQASLKNVLDYLHDRTGATILVDAHAFNKGAEDNGNIYDTAIQLPNLKKMPLAQVLRLVLNQMQPEATYLVRPTHLEITTVAAAAPRSQFVRAKFVNVPLETALRELSQQTGVGIVLDPRATKEARMPVTVTFPPETNLVVAVGLLADGANLKLRVLDRMLYVTTPANKAEIVPNDQLGGSLGGLLPPNPGF